jgi:DNA-binding transcriptional LysR family regulator
MDRLAAMQVYRTVVDGGSFAQAAKQLRISTASTSRNVSDLERYLGVILLRRSSRSLMVTEAGKTYYTQCCEILDKIADAESIAEQAKTGIQGRLRISIPISFGQQYIAPLLPAFMERYPDIEVDIWCTDQFVDFVEDNFDVAIRIARDLKTNLIAKELAPVRCAASASPAYLERYGIPETPGELREHACLTYAYATYGDSWRFLKQGIEHVFPVKSIFRSNNGDVIRLACLAGKGIAVQPTFLIGDDLRSGALVELFADYSFFDYSVYAVYPVDGRASIRIRAFVDFLEAAFAEAPPG